MEHCADIRTSTHTHRSTHTHAVQSAASSHSSSCAGEVCVSHIHTSLHLNLLRRTRLPELHNGGPLATGAAALLVLLHEVAEPTAPHLQDRVQGSLLEAALLGKLLAIEEDLAGLDGQAAGQAC